MTVSRLITKCSRRHTDVDKTPIPKKLLILFELYSIENSTKTYFMFYLINVIDFFPNLFIFNVMLATHFKKLGQGQKTHNSRSSEALGWFLGTVSNRDSTHLNVIHNRLMPVDYDDSVPFSVSVIHFRLLIRKFYWISADDEHGKYLVQLC